MSRDDAPVEPEEDLSRIPRPGALIRQARERRRLSREELGERTRLAGQVLAAVEAERFEALGQPVYARGYYRKCAEVLGLDAALLVEAYEKLSGTGSPVPEIRQRPSIRYREGPGWVTWTLGSAGLALVLGVGAWQFWRHSELLHLPGMEALAGMTAPSAEESAEPPPGSQAAEPAAGRGNEPTAAAPGSTIDTAAAVPPAAPVLRLTLAEGDSWVEVNDADQRSLIRKLLKQGETVALSGAPPFEVYLGRADVVDITLDGRRINFSQQIQDDLRARFRVGSPE